MALEAAQLALPTERVEIRKGRFLAVHHRPGRSRDADVAIFVHGSCASLVQWQYQIEHLAKSGTSVVAYDFYGCGRSAKPREWSCYSFGELYDDLVAIVKQYGARESSSGRNLLLAHSMGCSLALRLASEWGATGVNLGALALLSASDVVPPSASGASSAAAPRVLLPAPTPPPPRRAGTIFRLPECLLDRIQPLLSAGFASLALHEDTRAGRTPEHRDLLALSDVSGRARAHATARALVNSSRG